MKWTTLATLLVSATLLTGCGEEKPKSKADSKKIEEMEKSSASKYEKEMKKGETKKDEGKKDEGNKDEGKKDETKKDEGKKDDKSGK